MPKKIPLADWPEALASKIAEVQTGNGKAVFTWDDAPLLLMNGMEFLARESEMRGGDKKAILVSALTMLCPDDDCDELIPPFVDMIWSLYKLARPILANGSDAPPLKFVTKNTGRRHWQCQCVML